MNNFTLT